MKKVTLILALLGAIYLPFSLKAQYNQIEYTSNEFRVENLKIPNKAAGAENEPFYGDFFWEFGDGNYSSERSPTYQYSSNKIYYPRLVMTPFYSTDPPELILDTVKVNNAENNSIQDKYVSDAQMVHLYSNADNRLIPENEIQVVIHYKMPSWAPPNSKGYLLLFFNKEEESNLKFSPFLYPEEEEVRFYYSEKRVALSKALSGKFPAAAKTILSNLALNYDVLTFECPAVNPGTSRRLFLSMKSVTQLKKVIPEKKQKKIDVTLKAIWVPEVNNFQIDRQTANYVLTLLSVHDPNDLKVKPKRSNYKKDHAQELEYRVKFQNKGYRPVEKVTLEVPFPDNVNYDTIEIVSRVPDLSECPVCPKDFNRETYTKSCFEKDTISRISERIVVFTFHNISVHGTKEDGVSKNKYTKGNLVFKVWSNNTKIDLGASRARIVFEGGKSLNTGWASTRWREKSGGVKLGYNFPGKIGPFTKSTDGSLGNINLGVYYQNAPILTGLGWNAEISYNRFRHGSEVVRDAILPDADIQSLQVNLIDLKGEAIYQWGGIFRVGAGAGLSSLLAGNLETTSQRTIIRSTIDPVNNIPIDVATTFDGTADSQAGLLVRNKAGELFGESFTINGFAGWYTSLRGEVVLLNKVSLGISQEFRYYPSFYNQKCASFNQWQIYLRMKLFTQK